MTKEILSTLAIVLTFVAFVPYLHGIIRGQIKPHVFSWIIWGSSTFLVFLAQLADKGGVGAWPIGVSGAITLLIAFLAYKKKADRSITRMDWIFLSAALASLPLWYLTSNPLWAVVVLTTVDLLGFGPTLRKAYFNPFDEQLKLYAIMAFRNLLACLALENYSTTTLLFPTASGMACLLLIFMVSQRRSVLA